MGLNKERRCNYLNFLFVSNSYEISPNDCKTTQNDVEVWISEDGSMKITEKMQLTTKWHEINKDIVWLMR